jgi:integrase/recombinase XerD
MASLYRRTIVTTDPETGEVKKKRSRRWYGRYNDQYGRDMRVALCQNKDAAQLLLAELVRKSDRMRAGLELPIDEQVKMPLKRHLVDFEAHLKGKGVSQKHLVETLTQVRKIVTFAKWKFPTDMTTAAVTRFLADLSVRGLSAQTHNHYLKSIKSFCNWMEREERLIKNPVKYVSRLNVQADRRHNRRALSHDELTRLIEAAECGGPMEGILGRDRAMIYALAAGTGFRKGEIGSLTLRSFDLESDPCIVTVQAAFSKRRRKDVQVMHPKLVVRLKAWLEQKGDIEPKEILFPISHKTCGKYRKTHVMMQKDIEVARKAWLNESKDEDERSQREASDFLLYQDHDGRFADFHALRHTFITSLAKADVSPKTAQMLARHSDIRLTMDVYTHVDRGEQAEAIGKLKGV